MFYKNVLLLKLDLIFTLKKNIFVELLIDIIFNAQRIFKVFPEISII